MGAAGRIIRIPGRDSCPSTRVGWDNAVVESFFGTMKSELGDPIWESRIAARDAIFDYIETWYNRKRLHSTIGFVSPEQFESSLPKAA